MARDIDQLIAESQELRDTLLKTIGKLEAFSAALTVEAGRLRDEITDAGDNETEADVAAEGNE